MKNGIIISGSAREHGNTSLSINTLNQELHGEIIHLCTQNIKYYDYDRIECEDDFLDIVRRIIRADYIVLATPVYWYAMSGQMKVFLDRLTDCLKTEKELGRQLKGRLIYMLSNSNDDDRNEGFEVPFRLTAEYLHMHWGGEIHVWSEDGQLSTQSIDRIQQFSKLILES